MGRRPGPCRNVLIVSDQPTRHWVELGAHRVSYLAAGSVDDPVVLLLHGLASDATTWLPAIEALSAHRLRVLAVDLLGHGGSDKPELPYSLTLFGDMVGDFLDALGLGAVTMAGNSLGGAVAMQLGYHQPERVARLVLVSSGGLGKQVHPMLRVASLPGAGQLLGLAVNRRTGTVLRSPRLHGRLRLSPEQVVNLSRAGRNLVTREGRAAFITTLRSVIEPAGQRGSMLEMNYLAAHVPTLIVWSERDHVIPVRHAYDTHERLPGSRLTLLPGSSHEPHRRYAGQFAEAVAAFVASTEPAQHGP
jgi:pimeloyl-ACP methyl ester carboxylesterase